MDDGRHVKFNPADYPHLTLGYALGINKSEGSTFDRIFVALDPLLNANTLLVAMTRHREDVQAFVNREEIVDFKALVERVGYGTSKETIQDYQITESQKPYFENVMLYRDLIHESTTLREEIEGSLKENESLHKHPSFKGYQAFLSQKKEVAREIVGDWDNHLPFARLAGLRQDILEVEAGLRPRILSDLEYRASLQAQGYMKLVRETTQLWNTIKATHPPVLAKMHPLYGEYQAQKLERDTLAHTMHETPKLYLPFLRITQGEDGTFKDYWGNEVTGKERFLGFSLKQHAKAHEKVEAQKAFEEKLGEDEKENYLTVKAYQEAASTAASLFHLIKNRTAENEGPQPQQAWSKETLHHLFRETCTTRDKLALQIVSEADKYQSFIEKLSIREDKLLEHATLGDVREKTVLYMNEKDMAQRAARATELQMFLQTSTLAPQKIHPILKQAGVEQRRLAFDIAYNDKSPTIDPTKASVSEYIFNHVRDYLDTTREVGKAWKAQDTSTLQQATITRKEAAQRLVSHEEAFSLFKTLHPDRVEKLQAHAGDTHSSHRPMLAADHVLAELRGRFGDLAIDLLGAPNKHMSKQSELRFGTNGKMVVNMAGTKEGMWFDFATGQGGNIFQLIMREHGMDFKEAVHYCARFAGISDETFKTPLPQRVQRRQEPELEKLAEDKTRLEAVYTLYRTSKAIEGTVAETYLRKMRGIECTLSQDLRFLPKGTTFTYNNEEKTLTRDCLVSFGRNADGKLRSVQLTKLFDDGRRAVGPDGQKLNKIQYGMSKGAFVTVQHDPKSPRVFISEGLETALSLAMAGVEGTIVAAMGIHNIKNYEGSAREIILCADNDGPESPTKNVIQHTAAHFKNQDKTVTLITPRGKGQDFNDVLKHEGVREVQKYLLKYIRLSEAAKRELFTPDKIAHYKPEQHKTVHVPSAEHPVEQLLQAQGKTHAITPLQKAGSDIQETSQKEGLEKIQVDVGYTRLDSEQLKQTGIHPQQGKLPELSAYLERRLQEFQQDPFAREIKKDLFAHAKMLRRDPEQLDALRTHNPEIAKQMERLIRQQRAQEMER